MEDVDEIGVREVMRRSLVAANYGTRGCVVVMHASVADNGFALGANHAGLSYRECSQAMEMIAGLRVPCARRSDRHPADATAESLEWRRWEYLLSALGRQYPGASLPNLMRCSADRAVRSGRTSPSLSISACAPDEVRDEPARAAAQGPADMAVADIEEQVVERRRPRIGTELGVIGRKPAHRSARS